MSKGAIVACSTDNPRKERLRPQAFLFLPDKKYALLIIS